MDSTGTGIGLGMVEYWIRLRVPMEQALRLYKVSIIVFRNERFILNFQMIEKCFDFQHIVNNCQFC